MTDNLSSAGLFNRTAPAQKDGDGSCLLQENFLPLPLPQNCSAQRLDASTFRNILQGSASDVSDPLGEMGLHGLQPTGILSTTNPPLQNAIVGPQRARKGWRAPGPGAPQGLQRYISDENIHPVLHLLSQFW